MLRTRLDGPEVSAGLGPRQTLLSGFQADKVKNAGFQRGQQATVANTFLDLDLADRATVQIHLDT